MIRKDFLCATVSFALSAGIAVAQNSNPNLDKQLSRIDIGISGVGEFTKAVSGTVTRPGATNLGATVTQDASNTLGALLDIRYIAKPYVGFEFNYGYARYTENYNTAPRQIQTQANEFTLGYVATPKRTFYGFQPFVAVGAGSIEFKPTPRGGQGAPKQARAAYYYNVGVQQEFLSSHFGLRGSFRQVFFIAPDFGQNYLTIVKHTYTLQPTAGFYVRF